MLDILAAVVQDALVGALVLLLEVLHAQDDGAGLSVGPGLEAASLALGGQVFEPLFLQAHRYYKDKLSCMSDRGKSRGIDLIRIRLLPKRYAPCTTPRVARGRRRPRA